jgi:hypothetical protein
MNQFPAGTPVLVKYPLNKQEEQGDREAWPWLQGSILEQCGPNEWYVCVEVRELAIRADGNKPRKNTPPHKLYYPCCFRDSSEIRRAAR